MSGNDETKKENEMAPEAKLEEIREERGFTKVDSPDYVAWDASSKCKNSPFFELVGGKIGVCPGCWMSNRRACYVKRVVINKETQLETRLKKKMIRPVSFDPFSREFWKVFGETWTQVREKRYNKLDFEDTLDLNEKLSESKEVQTSNEIQSQNDTSSKETKVTQEIQFFENHYPSKRMKKDTSSFALQNKNPLPEPDYLYHFGLSSNMDLKKMFGDTKFVLMGGSSERSLKLAQKVLSALQIELPTGTILSPIGKTERYSLYKVGPIISVNHGMGMPSFNIFVHEITKLLYHAEAKDFIFMRIGTCGGLGVTPGTVVISSSVLNGELKPFYTFPILGTPVSRPTDSLNPELAQEIFNCSGEIPAIIGTTMSCDCFYEGQARLDGAICEYTEEEKMKFLEKAYEQGVRNIEMEALAFSAFCKKMHIPGAVLCSVLVNRLKGDQVSSTPQQLDSYTENSIQIALNFIKKKLGFRSSKTRNN